MFIAAINSLHTHTHTHTHTQDCPDQSFFAVFDGHVGAEAAAYSAVHLYHNIARHPSLLTDPELAIKEAVRMTDERCCEKASNGYTAVC